MEAAIYSLDLYCDSDMHMELHPTKYLSLDAQYTGETYSDCKRQAKADGWKWIEGQNICDKCFKQRKDNVK